MKKLKNQVRNEKIRQMSLTLTLPLDVPVHPMDAKGLSHFMSKEPRVVQVLALREAKSQYPSSGNTAT